MKFSTISLIGTVCFFLMNSGCKKDEDDSLPPGQQLAKDIMIIEDYLADNGLVAQRTASGLHYIITEEGSGEHPTVNDIVTIKYKGYLTDGTIFDQTTPANALTQPLSIFIPGWIEGIPYRRSGGGKGVLLIPSALGYGKSEVATIPANSVLIFDVTLLEIS
ncbi:MAG: FKBP-type peptidyl-prolyl cis-trans isomerase [Saprospiraceae bacterium]|nr:FKBP-type peptidyl-prolyl cis-trans isomerase [Saprospiraceae bacterium]